MHRRISTFAAFGTQTNKNDQRYDTPNHPASYRSTRRRTKYKYVYKLLNRQYIKQSLTKKANNTRDKPVAKQRLFLRSQLRHTRDVK